MNSVIKLTLLYFAFAFYSCSEKRDNFFWIQRSKFGSDTIRVNIEKTIHKDTADIVYNYSESNTVQFTFQLKNKFYALNSGVEKNYTSGKFVNKTHELTFLGDTQLNILNRKYTVFKYIEDDMSKDDDKANYYWIPEMGVIKIKSATFEQSLHSPDKLINDSLATILENISHW